MDLQGFSKRIIPVRPRLFRIARTYLSRPEDAEDIVQETLLKLWDRRHDLDRYESVESLAVQIVRNSCLDRIRSHGYSKTGTAEDIAGKSAAGPTPYQQAESSDNGGLLKKLISGLPEPQRLILHLRDVEEYSFEEIEAVTHLEINNIRVILSRARKKIREEYLKHHQYGTRDQGTAGPLL